MNNVEEHDLISSRVLFLTDSKTLQLDFCIKQYETFLSDDLSDQLFHNILIVLKRQVFPHLILQPIQETIKIDLFEHLLLELLLRVESHCTFSYSITLCEIHCKS